MNTKKQTTTVLTTILCIIMISLGCLTSNAQSEASKDFSITVTATGTNEIQLNCAGCEWTTLSYKIGNNKTHAINAYGMTRQDSAVTSDRLVADFIFAIKKNEKKYTLKGLRGTDWTELSFDCDETCSWTVNKTGVTQK